MRHGTTSSKQRSVEQENKSVVKQRKVNILDVPEPLFRKVLTFFEVKEIARVTQACKRLNSAARLNGVLFFQPHHRPVINRCEFKSIPKEYNVDCEVKAVSATGKLVALPPKIGALMIYGAVTGKRISYATGCQEVFSAAQCSDDGERILLRTAQGGYIFDCKRHVLLQIPERSQISKDGNTVMSVCSDEKTICVFDIHTDVRKPQCFELQQKATHLSENPITAFALSGNGQRIAFHCGENKEIEILELSKKSLSVDDKSNNGNPDDSTEFKLLNKIPAFFREDAHGRNGNPKSFSLQLNFEGNRLAIEHDRSFQVYNVERGNLQFGQNFACAFKTMLSSDGNFLLAVTNYARSVRNGGKMGILHEFRLWDLNSKEMIFKREKGNPDFFASSNLRWIAELQRDNKNNPITRIFRILELPALPTKESRCVIC